MPRKTSSKEKMKKIKKTIEKGPAGDKVKVIESRKEGKKKGGFLSGLFNRKPKHSAEPVSRPLPKKLPVEVLREFVAADIMTRKVYIVRSEDSLSYVVRLISENRITGVPVLDKNDNFVGLISELDITNYVGSKNLLEAQESNLARLKETKVSDVMRKNPVTVFDYTPVHDINDIMNRRKVNRVVVIDNKNRAVGIVSRTDMVKVISKEMMLQIMKKAPGKKRSELDTDIDELLEMVEKKGSVSADQVKRKLKIPEERIEEWADILEKHDLVDVVYSPLGKPTMRKKVSIDA